MRLSDLGYVPIDVELSSDSNVQFRYISGKDEQVLGRLLGQGLEPKRLTIEILQNQLVPSLEAGSRIEAWTNADLAFAAVKFSEANPSGFGRSINESLDVWVQFANNAHSYYDEIHEAVVKSLANIGDFASFKIPTASDHIGSNVLSVIDVMSQIGNTPSFEAMLHSVSGPQIANLSELGGSIFISDDALGAAGLLSSKVSEQVNSAFALSFGSYKSIADSFQDALSQTVNIGQINSFQDLLPNWSDQFRRLGKVRDGMAALEDAGFGYSVSFWEFEFFVSISELPSVERLTYIKDWMSGFISEEDSLVEIQALFAPPSIISARWPIVLEGISNHLEGRYCSAICVLLPQIEGIVNDMLVHTGAAELREGKFYTTPRDDKKSFELKGLQNKREHASKYSDIEERLAAYITASVVPNRNGILHGVEIQFAQAELSMHVLLVLLTLAVTAADLD